jgi:hypothetical protein
MKRAFYYCCLAIIWFMDFLAETLEAATSWINPDNGLNDELNKKKYK